MFKLGRTYKALLDELRLGGNVFLMNAIDPENLIYRFAKQLEFGNATMQVAGEAVRIVQRMNRDWMTTGRRPAGICGAALILAARMNNFRRTVREVVYVVKVTEITISQRLNEFSVTESGELTVDQFRSVQLENAHDPPSFTRAREGRKPSRSFRKKAADTAAEIEGVQDADVTGTRQPNRIDADGFAIPSIPIDPALFEANQRRRPSTVSATSEEAPEADSESTQATAGNQKSSRKPQLPQPTPDQLASEEALEDEMTAFLAKGSNMMENQAHTGPNQQPSKNVSESTEIDETEFESDPEVSNCLLSPMEVEIKERIWVHENKDYLRTQQAKALKRALAESESRPGMHKPRKRRKGRLGDVTYLEGEGEDGDGRSTRAATPAEATRRMLERRGFSKKINYRLVEHLFGEGDEDAKAKTESMSRSQSRSQSVASRRSASIEPEAASRRTRISTPSRVKPAGSSPIASPSAGEGHPKSAVTSGQTEPTQPNETVLGPAPDAKGEENEEEPDDEYDDDEGDEDDPDDGVDAAFSGHYGDYYDDGSDYDSD